MNMKIIDCFIFYNEKEMLNYRIKMLNKYVDYFVIVEATHTHSGKEKPLTSLEMPEIFGDNSDFKNKIIHIIIDDFPFIFPTIDYSKNEQWKNENYQRNCIEKGLNKITDLQNEDIIIITDLDEIPNPLILLKIKDCLIKVTANILEMDMYYYNLNTKHKDIWVQAKIITFGSFKELKVGINDIRPLTLPSIPNGGWHLSYFGDKYYIKNKIENFTHQEFNHPYFTSLENIEKRMNEFGDVYDRNYVPIEKIAIKDNKNLPFQYEKYLQNFIVL